MGLKVRMGPENKPTIFFAKKLNSFEELVDVAHCWNADFRQLSNELFKSEFFQAQVGNMLITNAHFGCAVDQRGGVPEGLRSFAIPQIDCSELRFFGHSVCEGVLLSFPTHGEIQAYNRPGFNILSFSLPEDYLEQLFEQHSGLGLPLNNVLGVGETIIPASTKRLDALRHSLNQMQLVLQNNSEPASQIAVCEQLHAQILISLLNIISGIILQPPVSARGSRLTVDQALEYINDRAIAVVTIPELCVVTGVSERTLQNHFKRELGMTPKVYMTGQRLNGVHRQLWGADSKKTRIVDVANTWGFWHMGQFAADYRKLNGELPSETLRRNN
jgi:AraC family ethanolamine operon transcriptional activator